MGEDGWSNIDFQGVGSLSKKHDDFATFWPVKGDNQLAKNTLEYQAPQNQAESLSKRSAI